VDSDKGLGVISGRKTSGVLIVRMHVRLEYDLAVLAAIVSGHVMSQHPKLETGHVSTTIFLPGLR